MYTYINICIYRDMIIIVGSFREIRRKGKRERE
jgi:hypothetical protein